MTPAPASRSPTVSLSRSTPPRVWAKVPVSGSASAMASSRSTGEISRREIGRKVVPSSRYACLRLASRVAEENSACCAPPGNGDSGQDSAGGERRSRAGVRARRAERSWSRRAHLHGRGSHEIPAEEPTLRCRDHRRQVGGAMEVSPKPTAGSARICSGLEKHLLVTFSSVAEPEIRSFLQENNVPYLVKPFEVADLISHARRLLQKAHAAASS